jgi:uncharacterized protein (TIGR00251 family)
MHETPKGVVFKATIQPKAARNEVVGLKGDTLKIRLTAPPVHGAANKMCIDFLAKSLKVKKSDLAIVRGQSSRTKQILVRQASPTKVASLLKI